MVDESDSGLPQELVDLIQYRATAYEIETVTVLKGPLATTLVKEAERRGKEPVDLLADIIEIVLRERYFSQILDGKSFPPKPAQRALDIDDDLTAAINKVAVARGVSGKRLVESILKAIVEDDLFAAILDR